MEKQLAQLMRNLKFYFWLLFLGSAAMGISLMLFIPELTINEEVSVRIRTAAIVSLLGLIPLGLWLYNKKVVSATLPDDAKQRASLIFKWFMIRFALIDTVFYFNMIVYALTRDTSLLYGTGIAFLFLFFLCKPNKIEITQLLTNEQEDE